MSINSVNNSKALHASPFSKTKDAESKEVKDEKSVAPKESFDKAEFSGTGKDDKKLSDATLKGIYDAKAVNETNMLKAMLGNVETNTKDKVLGQLDALEPVYTGFEADPTYGVEAVANDLLDFAKALSGGDPEKLELLKDAVVKGFEAAVGTDRSKWMDITTKTFEKTMSLFDEWENESATPPEEDGVTPPVEN